MCQLGLDVGLLSLLLGDGDRAVDSAQFDEGGVDERVVLADADLRLLQLKCSGDSPELLRCRRRCGRDRRFIAGRWRDEGGLPLELRMREFETGVLFADAQLRLLDAQFLALDSGIPKTRLLLLLLLVLLSTANVALSLNLQAEICSALLLDRQIYSANGQLRGSELEQLSRAHGGFRRRD